MSLGVLRSKYTYIKSVLIVQSGTCLSFIAYFASSSLPFPNSLMQRLRGGERNARPPFSTHYDSRSLSSSSNAVEKVSITAAFTGTQCDATSFATTVCKSAVETLRAPHYWDLTRGGGYSNAVRSDGEYGYKSFTCACVEIVSLM
jgi:hypothetical protein